MSIACHRYAAALVVPLVAMAVRCGADEPISYAKHVQPLFAQKCLNCHGPDKAEGGLRLHRRDLALGVLDSGELAIVPRDPSASELLKRVRCEDPDSRMPPAGDPLSRDEIALLARWISEGAVWQTHWAYQSLSTEPLPAVEDASWPENAIDFFVLARLEEAGLRPAPVAHRATLVKRLYYDLIGLPPEPAVVDDFLDNGKPDAYEYVVDQLLSSPHFGERWGRHWLDKARYADSDGYEKDNHRPDAWRYRDWVIHAINDDMPIDEFTVQQIAGDMIPEATPQMRLATAFHRQTLTNTEGGADQEQWRVAAVMDRTETLGAVWLGLTIGCARCHSHKYDQISHREYYQLYAYFNNGDEANATVPKECCSDREVVPADAMMEVRVLEHRNKAMRPTHILRRGEFREPLGVVEAGTLASLPPIRPRDGKLQSDRLDLARWLVDGHNPLTPRVIVNHLWKHLFGYGIVRTMNDFGVRGDPPSHPGLIDFLAGELIEQGWSRKAMIRRIVMSATYRQSSKHRRECLEQDPTNRLLHRQNRFRVEAEIIRDATLAASGLLTRKIGGPSVFPPIDKSVTAVTYNSSFQWKTSSEADRYRRGMYTYFKRTAPHPNLITFDCPDSNVTNAERNRSNTPLAALTTLNNEVYVEAAQHMAKHVLQRSELVDDRGRIRYALRRCIARVPKSIEIDDFEQLLRVNRRWYQQHPIAATELAGKYATAAPEESAAWTATLRMMLNLDEFISRE